ncbi:hypothetical protein [Paenibacillus hexagrammi]|uniref:Uncharacterized protein n=1 Tax=Paenibacillus hexagrammi TaxID=2908839 RepID=A0ABY3SIA0_9BACL|nr:hypothetical protein [Paenibacillus sp. YPD9-1]UJF33223.1 hypothetical protein L0M14_27435 [Paenibacillus sp. YPD9-1]
MKLLVGNEIYKYANEAKAVTGMLNHLSTILSEQQLALVSLNVDGEEIDSDFYGFISEHLDSIQQVVANTVTLQEMRDETILSLEQYVERAVPLVEPLAGDFTKGGHHKAGMNLLSLLRHCSGC